MVRLMVWGMAVCVWYGEVDGMGHGSGVYGMVRLMV